MILIKRVRSELLINGNNQNITLFTNFSKAEKQTDKLNLEPDLSYGAFFKKINSTKFGLLNINLNYKHTGKFIDYDGSKNSRQKSTDLLDLSIKKIKFETF